MTSIDIGKLTEIQIFMLNQPLATLNITKYANGKLVLTPAHKTVNCVFAKPTITNIETTDNHIRTTYVNFDILHTPHTRNRHSEDSKMMFLDSNQVFY